MPTTIQVILQQDVRNLGKTGELVKVRPGFARNFLLPNGIAAPATSKNVNRLEHEKKAASARNAKAKGEAQELATKLGGLSLTITHKAGEEGKLFGSVTTKEIEAALKEKGVDIDRRKIELADPIKAVGEYTLPIKLGHEVTANVKVVVSAK
jgi:large subunit ribosomal protein L9